MLSGPRYRGPTSEWALDTCSIKGEDQGFMRLRMRPTPTRLLTIIPYSCAFCQNSNFNHFMSHQKVVTYDSLNTSWAFYQHVFYQKTNSCINSLVAMFIKTLKWKSITLKVRFAMKRVKTNEKSTHAIQQCVLEKKNMQNAKAFMI